jgi:hypothetical protein
MYSVLFLLLVLVIVISVEVYRATEGFADAPVLTTVPTPTPTSMSTPTITNAPIPSTTSDLDALAHDKQERAKLLRDIQEAVRTELLADKKATIAHAQPIIKNGAESSCPGLAQSSAEQQGKEAITARAVDMSQYIRKDSIPCWNCTLDY